MTVLALTVLALYALGDRYLSLTQGARESRGLLSKAAEMWRRPRLDP